MDAAREQAFLAGNQKTQHSAKLMKRESPADETRFRFERLTSSVRVCPSGGICWGRGPVCRRPARGELLTPSMLRRAPATSTHSWLCSTLMHCSGRIEALKRRRKSVALDPLPNRRKPCLVWLKGSTRCSSIVPRTLFRGFGMGGPSRSWALR
jgi:hypothetical protein